MRNSVLFFACFIFLPACQKDGKEIIGHWHVWEYDKKSDKLKNEYFTLDFLFQTSVILDKGQCGNDGTHGYFSSDRKTIAFGGDFLFEHFEINNKNDTLYLFQKDGKEFHGYKCGKNCCDKQRDFFGGSSMKIDLPVIQDTLNLIQHEETHRALEHPVLFGLPKHQYENTRLSEPRLELIFDYKFYFQNFQNLPFHYEAKKTGVPFNLRKDIFFVVYANTENKLSQLNRLIKELQKLNEQKIYIALREKDYDDSLKIWLKKIEPEEDIEKIIQKYFKTGDFNEIN